jgi:hemerythrin
MVFWQSRRGFSPIKKKGLLFFGFPNHEVDMESIVWSDNWNTGIGIIDMQHRKLIEMVNRFISRSDLSVRSEALSEILTEMTQYAGEHFRTEEELMEEYQYPLLEEHKAQHREFRVKMVDLCNATMDGVEDVPRIMAEYLLDWVRDHLQQQDMKYRDFFAERGVR